MKLINVLKLCKSSENERFYEENSENHIVFTTYPVPHFEYHYLFNSETGEWHYESYYSEEEVLEHLSNIKF